jgi:hypothetical protein
MARLRTFLLIFGGVFVLMSALPIVRFLNQRADIWWTPKALGLPLAETSDRVEIYVRDVALQEHVKAGRVQLLTDSGATPVTESDMRLRFNNWDRIRGAHHSRAPVQAWAPRVCSSVGVFGWGPGSRSRPSRGSSFKRPPKGPARRSLGRSSAHFAKSAAIPPRRRRRRAHDQVLEIGASPGETQARASSQLNGVGERSRTRVNHRAGYQQVPRLSKIARPSRKPKRIPRRRTRRRPLRRYPSRPSRRRSSSSRRRPRTKARGRPGRRRASGWSARSSPPPGPRGWRGSG